MRKTLWSVVQEDLLHIHNSDSITMKEKKIDKLNIKMEPIHSYERHH